MINRIFILFIAMIVLHTSSAIAQTEKHLSTQCIAKMNINVNEVKKIEDILSFYNEKMRLVMVDRGTKGTGKKKLMDQLVAERDKKLKEFLSQEQVNILFSGYKEHSEKKADDFRKNGPQKVKSS